MVSISSNSPIKHKKFYTGGDNFHFGWNCNLSVIINRTTVEYFHHIPALGEYLKDCVLYSSTQKSEKYHKYASPCLCDTSMKLTVERCHCKSKR